MNPDVILEFSNITKQFSKGQVTALDDVSATVRRGEVVAILGENGAGKTTLIDLILGLTTPTAGRIEVNGQSSRNAVNAQQVGAILQTGGLLPDVTVEDTLKMIASGYSEHVALADVVKQARLEPLLKRKVGKCSGGEQQRLKCALALLGDPELIVLDEPTAGMDPSARRNFWADIHARAERGTTVLFTTHYMDEAEDFSKRIIMLHKGRIMADLDTPSMLALSKSVLVEANFPGAAPELSERTEVDEVTWLSSAAGEPAGTSRRVRLRTRDSDSLLRHLVTETDATDFTVQRAKLDDIFISMQRDADVAADATPDVAVAAGN